MGRRGLVGHDPRAGLRRRACRGWRPDREEQRVVRSRTSPVAPPSVADPAARPPVPAAVTGWSGPARGLPRAIRGHRCRPCRTPCGPRWRTSGPDLSTAIRPVRCPLLCLPGPIGWRPAVDRPPVPAPEGVEDVYSASPARARGGPMIVRMVIPVAPQRIPSARSAAGGRRRRGVVDRLWTPCGRRRAPVRRTAGRAVSVPPGRVWTPAAARRPPCGRRGPAPSRPDATATLALAPPRPGGRGAAALG